MMRPRPRVWTEVGSGLQPAKEWSAAGMCTNPWGLTSGEWVGQADFPQATCTHQLSSAPATPVQGPAASYRCPTLKPKAGAGKGDFWQWFAFRPPRGVARGCPRVLPAGADPSVSLGMKVDIGACELSPTDGALFVSLSPQTRGRPE